MLMPIEVLAETYTTSMPWLVSMVKILPVMAVIVPLEPPPGLETRVDG
jgi:hypothetical protein